MTVALPLPRHALTTRYARVSKLAFKSGDTAASHTDGALGVRLAVVDDVFALLEIVASEGELTSPVTL